MCLTLTNVAPPTPFLRALILPGSTHVTYLTGRRAVRGISRAAPARTLSLGRERERIVAHVFARALCASFSFQIAMKRLSTGFGKSNFVNYCLSLSTRDETTMRCGVQSSVMWYGLIRLRPHRAAGQGALGLSVIRSSARERVAPTCVYSACINGHYKLLICLIETIYDTGMGLRIKITLILILK